MRPIRAVLATVILLVAPIAMAQDCDPSLFLQQRGYPVGMDVSGDVLAVSDGAGLTLVELDDRRSPVIRSSVFTPDESRAVVFVSANRVALLTAAAVLLYDVSGVEPRLVDSTEVDATDLHLWNGELVAVGREITVFTTAGDSLKVVDSVELTDSSTASAVIGGALYVSVKGAGTSRFDGSLFEQSRIGVVATAIAGTGDLVLLGRGTSGLAVVDYSDGARPEIVAQVSGGVAADELLIAGSRLYAAGAGGSLHILDLSDPSDPVVTAVPGSDVDLMTADDRYLYSYGFGSDRFGRRIETGPYLTIRDHGASGLPVVGSLGESTGPITGVATDGEVAWIADQPYLRAIDLSTGAEIWSVRLEQPFDRVRFENGRLILYGRAWVHLLDPYADSEKLLATWDTNGIAGGGVTFSGQWLTEANKASGFHVLDVSNPPQVIQRGGLINNGLGQWLEVVGIPGAVYGVTTEGMKIVSIPSDPHAVEVVGFMKFGAIRDVEIIRVDGKPYLLVLNGQYIHVHDLSAPLAPAELAVVDVGQAKQIAVSGTRAWVLREDATVLGIELANPAAPQVTASFDGPREGISIAVSDDVVVVADVWSLWARPLTVNLQSAPALGVSVEGESALIIWESPLVSTTEIQLSSDPSFATIDRSWTTTGEPVSVESSDAPRWVRARFIQGCAVSPWSTPILIEPVSERAGRARATRRP